MEERTDLDLAIVRVPQQWIDRATTRFTVARQDALHPAAVCQSTDCMRVATIQDSSYRVELRYETWVMYRSRQLAPRPDLRVLAQRLSDLDPDAAWTADAPGALTPTLRHTGATALAPEAFVGALTDFLRRRATAWDPFASR